MRKRILTKQVAVVLSEEMHQQLIDTTDRLEIPVSQFIRDLLAIKLKEIEKEI
jgi:hypothetical protein